MKKHIDNDEILDEMELDTNNNAVSHTEATGLIPSIADDEYKRQSYKEIVNYEQRPIARRERYKSRQSAD